MTSDRMPAINFDLDDLERLAMEMDALLKENAAMQEARNNGTAFNIAKLIADGQKALGWWHFIEEDCNEAEK